MVSYAPFACVELRGNLIVHALVGCKDLISSKNYRHFCEVHTTVVGSSQTKLFECKAWMIASFDHLLLADRNNASKVRRDVEPTAVAIRDLSLALDA
jgi:hypothetical protein